MSKTKDYLIDQINKQKEIEDYKKFKESLESCTKKLSRCDNEKK